MAEQVFFVEREPSLLRSLEPALAHSGFDLRWCTSGEQVMSQMSRDADAVVVIALPGEEGDAVCRDVSASFPRAAIIVCAGPGEHELLEALPSADIDFLSEPVTAPALVARLRRAIRNRDMRLEAGRLRQSILDAGGFGELVGTSSPMQELYALMDRAAKTDASVLITGESGTGKELVARALHNASRRREHPFVAINCSAVPEPLLESELFGHVKGAFTDAHVSRSGLFVKASGGTIFLDEIGDMPLTLQPKLLRVLQERVVRPVGGDTETAIDVRVIAATNRNLEDAVAAREFREDLYYRLHVIHVEVPPLRSRAGDILLIAERLIERFARSLGKEVHGLSRRAASKLMAYGWPGNVRELQNCIERAVALTRDDEVQLEDLPPKIREYQPSHVLVVSNQPSELVPLDEIERRYIIKVLDAVGGNKKEAAKILGLDRKTLYRKLARYSLAGASGAEE